MIPAEEEAKIRNGIWISFEVGSFPLNGMFVSCRPDLLLLLHDLKGLRTDISQGLV